MDALFWQRLHGGSTHFPIVLLLMSVVFDLVACRSREETLRHGLHAAGLGSAVVGVLGGCGAVVSGLVMSDGRMLGSGFEKMHHLFVWPAFGLCVALVMWRFIWRRAFLRHSFTIYLASMSVASALMMSAGYWGGEMLLGTEIKTDSAPATTAVAGEKASVARGHDLFLMNCAQCHGDDALGTEEGPNLATRRRSATRIASVIKNGIKGEMPRFNQKLNDEDVELLVRFLRSLKHKDGADG